jgi:hypothetical protein
MPQQSPPIRLVADRATTSGRTKLAPFEHAPAVDFMYVGVQKAGSSWLFEALSRHPDLLLGRGGEDKDTCFFSYHYDRGYEWYERHFPGSGQSRLRGEISTSYFACGDAPERIARYNPRMKLVLCLRNPVDRVISNHLHEIRLGHVSQRNYRLADGIRNNPAYLEQSCYARLLQRWLIHFPRESIHTVLFEALFAEPRGHLAALYEFLGVSTAPSDDFPNDKVNESRVPRSGAVDTLTRNATAALRTLRLTSAVDGMKRLGVDRLVRRANAISHPERLADDDVRSELRRYFAAENRKLAELTGLDLELWHQ